MIGCLDIIWNRISSSSNSGDRGCHIVRNDHCVHDAHDLHDLHDVHDVHDVQWPAHILWLSSAMVCEPRLGCGAQFQRARDELPAPWLDMERVLWLVRESETRKMDPIRRIDTKFRVLCFNFFGWSLTIISKAKFNWRPVLDKDEDKFHLLFT